MKYIVLSYWNRQCISNYMLHDLSKVKNVKNIYIYKSKVEIKNDLIRGLYNYVFDKRWRSENKRLQMLIKRLIKKSHSDDIVIIMTNEMLCHIETKDLIVLQKNNVKLVLILIDPLSATYNTAMVAKQALSDVKFDLVFSFDPNDSVEYGFEYCNTLYSKIIDKKDNDSEYDVCYIGNIKERIGFILNLMKAADRHGVELLLKVSGCNEEVKKKLPKETILEKVIEYSEVIKMSINANCIFDITQKKQTGVTLRYYEAVVYNKKLLTNNCEIKKLPFYDERYIRFYDSLDDVDWDWVTKQENIDYGYKGEFSPINLLKRIEMRING